MHAHIIYVRILYVKVYVRIMVKVRNKTLGNTDSDGRTHGMNLHSMNKHPNC